MGEITPFLTFEKVKKDTNIFPTLNIDEELKEQLKSLIDKFDNPSDAESEYKDLREILNNTKKETDSVLLDHFCEAVHSLLYSDCKQENIKKRTAFFSDLLKLCLSTSLCSSLRIVQLLNEMLSETNEKEHNPQFFFEKYNQFIIRSVLEQKICYTEDNKQPLYFFTDQYLNSFLALPSSSAKRSIQHYLHISHYNADINEFIAYDGVHRLTSVPCNSSPLLLHNALKKTIQPRLHLTFSKGDIGLFIRIHFPSSFSVDGLILDYHEAQQHCPSYYTIYIDGYTQFFVYGLDQTNQHIDILNVPPFFNCSFNTSAKLTGTKEDEKKYFFYKPDKELYQIQDVAFDVTSHTCMYSCIRLVDQYGAIMDLSKDSYLLVDTISAQTLSVTPMFNATVTLPTSEEDLQHPSPSQDIKDEISKLVHIKDFESILVRYKQIKFEVKESSSLYEDLIQNHQEYLDDYIHYLSTSEALSQSELLFEHYILCSSLYILTKNPSLLSICHQRLLSLDSSTYPSTLKASQILTLLHDDEDKNIDSDISNYDYLKLYINLHIYELTCPQMKEQIYGMTNLTSILTNIQNLSIQYPEVATDLFTFILQKNILKILFESHVNIEVIRLSTELLLTYYSCHPMDEQDIHILYNSIYNIHVYESMQCTNVFCQLITIMQTQQLNTLLSLILNTHIEKCTDQTIQVLCTVMKMYCVQLESNSEATMQQLSKCIDYIYRYGGTCKPESSEEKYVIYSLLPLYDNDTFCEMLCLYLSQQMNDRSIALPYFSFLLYVDYSIFTSSEYNDSLLYMYTHCSKADEFIVSLYEQVHTAFQMIGHTSDYATRDYLTNIVHRVLTILKFFMDHYDSPIISLQGVYTNILTQACPLTIQIYILQWLYDYYIHVIETYEDKKLNQDIISVFNYLKVNHLNGDRSGIKLLILLFEEINLRNDNIAWDDDKGIFNRNKEVLAFEEKIWHIAIYHDKSTDILNYIIDLYINLSPSILKKKNDLIEKFLKLVSQCLNSSKDSHNSNYVIRRCIQILTLYYKRHYLLTPQKRIMILLPTSHETLKNNILRYVITPEITVNEIFKLMYGENYKETIQKSNIRLLRGVMYGNKSNIILDKSFIPYNGEMFFIEDVNHPGSANSAGYYIDRNSNEFSSLNDYINEALLYMPYRLPSSVPNSPLYHPKPSDSLYQCLLYMLKSIHNPSTQLYMQEALYILGFLPPYPQLLENIKVINQYLDWKTLLDFRYPGYVTYILEVIHYMLYDCNNKVPMSAWFHNSIFVNNGYKAFFELFYQFEPSSTTQFPLYTLLTRFILNILYHQQTFANKKILNISDNLHLFETKFTVNLDYSSIDMLYTLLSRIAEIIMISVSPSTYQPIVQPQNYMLQRISSRNVSMTLSQSSIEEMTSPSFPPPLLRSYYTGAYKEQEVSNINDVDIEQREEEENGLMNQYEKKNRGEGEEKPVGELLNGISNILNTVEVEGDEGIGKKRENDVIDMLLFIEKKDKENKVTTVDVQDVYSLLNNRLKLNNKFCKYDIDLIDEYNNCVLWMAELLVQMTTAQNILVKYLLGYTQLSQWLYTVLIQNPTTSARLSIARALYESVIADNTSAPVLLYTHLLRIFDRNFFRLSENEVDYYCELMILLLNYCCQHNLITLQSDSWYDYIMAKFYESLDFKPHLFTSNIANRYFNGLNVTEQGQFCKCKLPLMNIFQKLFAAYTTRVLCPSLKTMIIRSINIIFPYLRLQYEAVSSLSSAITTSSFLSPYILLAHTPWRTGIHRAAANLLFKISVAYPSIESSISKLLLHSLLNLVPPQLMDPDHTVLHYTTNKQQTVYIYNRPSNYYFVHTSPYPQLRDCELPVGVQNLGNTCFMSSFIQLLTNCGCIEGLLSINTCGMPNRRYDLDIYNDPSIIINDTSLSNEYNNMMIQYSLHSQGPISADKLPFDTHNIQKSDSYLSLPSGNSATPGSFSLAPTGSAIENDKIGPGKTPSAPANGMFSISYNYNPIQSSMTNVATQSAPAEEEAPESSVNNTSMMSVTTSSKCCYYTRTINRMKNSTLILPISLHNINTKNSPTTSYSSSLRNSKDHQEKKQEATESDSYVPTSLRALQEIICDLRYGSCNVVCPLKLITTLKDYEGNPMDSNIQFDINEFCNILFEQMEREGAKDWLTSTFYGNYNSCIRSLECSHISIKHENFTMLSVNINKANSLEQALEQIVTVSELKDDNKWYCSDCKKKVNACRRTLLDNTKQLLMVHINRIQFDYSTMTRSKINSYCSFPLILNVYPYTYAGMNGKKYNKLGQVVRDSLWDIHDQESEHIKKEDCYYELIGIIVHNGTADSGHYYYFGKSNDKRNKERTGDNEGESFTTDEDVWYLYNDMEVLQFKPEKIIQDCFGGKEKDGTEKTYSATVLLYSRIKDHAAVSPSLEASDMPDGLSIDVEEEVPADLASALSPFQKPQNSFINSLVPIDKNVPPSMSLLSYICTNMKANDTLFELYSPYIGKYIIQTLTEHKKKGFNNVDNYQETLKVAILYYIYILSTSTKPNPTWSEVIGLGLMCSPTVSEWFLILYLYNYVAISPLLSICCAESFKVALTTVLNSCIQSLIIRYKKDIALYVKNDLKSAYKTPVIALLEKLIFKINNSLYEAFDSISDNLSYTNFIIKLFKASNKNPESCLSLMAVYRKTHIYLLNLLQPTRNVSPHLLMLHISTALDLLLLLLPSLSIKDRSTFYPGTKSDVVIFSATDIKQYLSFDFFMYIYKYCPLKAQKLLRWVLFANNNYTNYMQTMLCNLPHSEFKFNINIYLPMIRDILCISDDYQTARLDRLLSLILSQMRYFTENLREDPMYNSLVIYKLFNAILQLSLCNSNAAKYIKEKHQIEELFDDYVAVARNRNKVTF